MHFAQKLDCVQLSSIISTIQVFGRSTYGHLLIRVGGVGGSLHNGGHFGRRRRAARIGTIRGGAKHDRGATSRRNERRRRHRSRQSAQSPQSLRRSVSRRGVRTIRLPKARGVDSSTKIAEGGVGRATCSKCHNIAGLPPIREGVLSPFLRRENAFVPRIHVRGRPPHVSLFVSRTCAPKID